jgi:hypothetical protein
VKNIVPFSIFESISSNEIDYLVDSYANLPQEIESKSLKLGKYGDLDVVIINPDLLKTELPEWQVYKGSHHWGKKTSYIPEKEIWIVNGLEPKNFRRILNHEIIEREMMRALEEEHGMDKQTAWFQSHYYVKQMGF